MQLFFVIVAFLACTVAPCAAVFKRCDQLPTNISCDARQTVEPRGKQWMLYRSNVPQERCLNMSYVSNRNNNSQQATFTFWDCKDKFHYTGRIDVNSNMTSWTLTGDSGVPMTCHKLILNDKRSWWCLYCCDPKGEKIQHAFCGVLDDQGKKELDAELAKKFPDKDLPLPEGQTLDVVYNKNCMAESG